MHVCRCWLAARGRRHAPGNPTRRRLHIPAWAHMIMHIDFRKESEGREENSIQAPGLANSRVGGGEAENQSGRCGRGRSTAGAGPDGCGKLTRWRCSEFSAGTSRPGSGPSNRKTKRAGDRAANIPVRSRPARPERPEDRHRAGPNGCMPDGSDVRRSFRACFVSESVRDY